MTKKEKALLDALKKFYEKDPAKLREMVEQLLEDGDISYGAANEVLDELPDISIQAPKSTRAKTVMPSWDPCGPPYSGSRRHMSSCDSPRRSYRPDPCGSGSRSYC